jgi:uncharacterized protein YoxC
MPLEISVLIIAIACAIFVTVALIALRLLVMRMQTLTEKTIAMQRDLQELSNACGKLMQTTDDTVKEIGEAAATVNHVVGAAKDMGQSISETAAVMKQVSSILSQRAAQYVEQDRGTKQLDDMMQWTELAMSAWQLWQTGRQKSKYSERRD